MGASDRPMDEASRLARKLFRAHARAERSVRLLQEAAWPYHKTVGEAKIRYEPKKHATHGFTRPGHVVLARYRGRSRTVALNIASSPDVSLAEFLPALQVAIDMAEEWAIEIAG